MKPWVQSETHKEGKFLVVRRDGTVPAWPHFVLGARDPNAPAALIAYAAAMSSKPGHDLEYVLGIIQLAKDFDKYRAEHGHGDPEAAPHRIDDRRVLRAMRGDLPCVVHLRHGPNEVKP